jgi:hypothetical protein
MKVLLDITGQENKFLVSVLIQFTFETPKETNQRSNEVKIMKTVKPKQNFQISNFNFSPTFSTKVHWPRYLNQIGPQKVIKSFKAQPASL